MVRLVGNIHGNEAVGREVVLAFTRCTICSIGAERYIHLSCRHLLLGYGQDDRLTRLVDSNTSCILYLHPQSALLTLS